MSIFSSLGKNIKLGASKIGKKFGSGFRKLKSKFFHGGIDVTSENENDISSLGDSSELLPKRKKSVEDKSEEITKAIDNKLRENGIDESVTNHIWYSQDSTDDILDEQSENLKKFKINLDQDLSKGKITEKEYSEILQQNFSDNTLETYKKLKESIDNSTKISTVANAELMAESIKNQVAGADETKEQSESRGMLSKIYDLTKLNILSLKQSSLQYANRLSPITVFNNVLDKIFSVIRDANPLNLILLMVILIAKGVAKLAAPMKKLTFKIKTFIKDIPRLLNILIEKTSQFFDDSWIKISGLADNFKDWLMDRLGRAPILKNIDYFKKRTYTVYKEYMQGKADDGSWTKVVVEYRKFADGTFKVVDAYHPSDKEYELASKGKAPGVHGKDYRYLGTTGTSLLSTYKWNEDNWNLSHREQEMLPAKYSNIGPYVGDYDEHSRRLSKLESEAPSYDYESQSDPSYSSGYDNSSSGSSYSAGSDRPLPATKLKGNIKTAMDFLISKGLTVAQAAGLVGNLQRESELNPNIVNKRSGAYGIAQWLGERKTRLFSRYGRKPSLQNELEYLWWELNNTHKSGLRHLKASNTPEQAAAMVFGYYEFSVGPAGAIEAMNSTGQNGRKSYNLGISNAKRIYNSYSTTSTNAESSRHSTSKSKDTSVSASNGNKRKSTKQPKPRTLASIDTKPSTSLPLEKSNNEIGSIVNQMVTAKSESFNNMVAMVNKSEQIENAINEVNSKSSAGSQTINNANVIPDSKVDMNPVDPRLLNYGTS